jgi:hypothetical protein
LLSLAPHESCLLMEVGQSENDIVYSTGHFFPGAEVESIEDENIKWRGQLATDCTVWLKTTECKGDV